MTDEVYEHLVFDEPHVAIVDPARGLGADRLHLLGRQDVLHDGLEDRLGDGPRRPRRRGARDQAVAHLRERRAFQPAIATGLRLPDAYFAGIAQTLRGKRDLLGEGLRAAGFAVSVPSGSYFTVADAAPLGAGDAADFCRALPHTAGVVAIPMTAFVTPEHRAQYATLVRFAACKRVDVLEDAASRLASLGG